MTERQTLSQYKLANFLACQRRFQLRYLRRLPWPASPLPERTEQVLQQVDSVDSRFGDDA